MLGLYARYILVGFLAAATNVIFYYLDIHSPSLTPAVLSVLTTFVSLVGLIIYLVKVIFAIWRRSFAQAGAIASGIAVFVIAPGLGQFYTLIDMARFYYNRDFYYAQVEQAPVQPSGKKFIVFDWGGTDGVLSAQRTYSLIYDDGEPNFPLGPSGCNSQRVRIAENFYSVRTVC